MAILTRIGFAVLQNPIDDAKLKRRMAEGCPSSASFVNEYYRVQYAAQILDERAFIIYRETSKDNPDESRWQRVNYRKEVDRRGHQGMGGRVHICFNNESGDSDLFLEYTLNTARYMTGLGLRGGFMVFNTGTPKEERWLKGDFDEILREIVKGGHLLLLHDYSNRDTLLDSSPHLVGRMLYVNERCAMIGLPPPDIVVKEIGLAELDNRGKTWKKHGLTGGQYAQQFIALDKATVRVRSDNSVEYGYGHFPNVRGFEPYSYGSNFNDWIDYDVQDSPEFWEAVTAYARSGQAVAWDRPALPGDGCMLGSEYARKPDAPTPPAEDKPPIVAQPPVEPPDDDGDTQPIDEPPAPPLDPTINLEDVLRAQMMLIEEIKGQNRTVIKAFGLFFGGVSDQLKAIAGEFEDLAEVLIELAGDG